MNEVDFGTINRMRAVTISREYGSGGGEIAARLAKRLGWRLVDHALVERVAGELGTCMAEAEAHDERSQGMFERSLNNLIFVNPALLVSAPPEAFLSDEAYREALNKIVRTAALRGHVVVVGRASQVILAGIRDVMHVRVVAPFEKRVAYVMRREGLDRHAAETRIRRKEHDRTGYLEREYHHRPDDAHLYDLILNTSRLDLDSAIELICTTMREIADGLSTSTGQLGPAVGLDRYPAPPADFTPPVH